MWPPRINSRLKPLLAPFFRHKHAPDHWSLVRKKNHPIDKAMAHFDDFYKDVFTTNWPSIREGLLGKRKYVAIVNNYSDCEEVMGGLELKGAINMRTLFNLEREYEADRMRKRSYRQKLAKIHAMARENEEENLEPTPESSPQITHSLGKSLDEAHMDTTRLIDASNTELLQEFIPATKIKGREDFIPESTHYNFYSKTGGFDVHVEPDSQFHFPEHLNVYCFEEDNDSDFEAAKIGTTGVLGYYLMDGGSILPVLALDIRPKDHVLDMCAAPGGKSLLAIQTLYPDCVTANDLSKSRTDRIYRVAQQFLYDVNERWIDTGRLRITKHDARFLTGDRYDKVLVDVPCTTDRQSVTENDNNYFKPTRTKERLKLPELQCELLVNALKLVKPGGNVVYSTCSLSPVQNDGVVHMALKRIWEETKIEVCVMDLSLALRQTKSVFTLASPKLMKYGNLVLPQPGQNYGPTYFCKLKRLK